MCVCILIWEAVCQKVLPDVIKEENHYNMHVQTPWYFFYSSYWANLVYVKIGVPIGLPFFF